MLRLLWCSKPRTTSTTPKLCPLGGPKVLSNSQVCLLPQFIGSLTTTMTPTALSSALWSVELDGAKRRASQRQSEERIEDDQTHQSDSNQALALNNDDDTQSIMTFETYSTWDAASRLSDHGTLGCDRLSIVPVNMLASITEEESVPRFYDPSKVLTEMNLRITKTWEFIVSLQRDMDNEDQAELDALKMILGRLTDNTLDQVSQWCLGSSTRQPKELSLCLFPRLVVCTNCEQNSCCPLSIYYGIFKRRSSLPSPRSLRLTLIVQWGHTQLGLIVYISWDWQHHMG